MCSPWSSPTLVDDVCRDPVSTLPPAAPLPSSRWHDTCALPCLLLPFNQPLGHKSKLILKLPPAGITYICSPCRLGEDTVESRHPKTKKFSAQSSCGAEDGSWKLSPVPADLFNSSTIAAHFFLILQLPGPFTSCLSSLATQTSPPQGSLSSPQPSPHMWHCWASCWLWFWPINRDLGACVAVR